MNMRPALMARANQSGKAPTEAALLAMRQPWMGCNAGRAISGELDVSDLWQRIQTIRSRRAAWLRVIEAPNEHAAIPSLGGKPPPGDDGESEARAVDPRTDAEREHDAERAWSVIVDALRCVDPLLIRYIEQVVVLDRPLGGPLAQILRSKELVDAIGG